MAQEPLTKEQRLAERQALIATRKAENASRPAPTNKDKADALTAAIGRTEKLISQLQARLADQQAELANLR